MDLEHAASSGSDPLIRASDNNMIFLMTNRQVKGEAVAPAKLAHVVLRSRAFDAAQRWWADVLSGRIVHADGFLAFITYDDEHHRVALINIGEGAAPPGTGAGMDHVAFTYAGLGDLLATYVRLRDQGVTPHWCINHGPTTSLYYRDPDGNQVELQIDNFATLADLAAWFATGVFATNPIGVEFDPDDLVARYEAGESIEALTVRAD
jgi:catechol 2,3-dioxygenase-like lactoylglutathione lyase family enzyme